MLSMLMDVCVCDESDDEGGQSKRSTTSAQGGNLQKDIFLIWYSAVNI